MSLIQHFDHPSLLLQSHKNNKYSYTVVYKYMISACDTQKINVEQIEH